MKIGNLLEPVGFVPVNMLGIFAFAVVRFTASKHRNVNVASVPP